MCKHDVIHKTGRYITKCVLVTDGPQLTRAEKFVKLGRVLVFDICDRTN